MNLKEFQDDKMFLLTSTDPIRNNFTFLCQPEDEEIYNAWIDKIKHMMDSQNAFIKGIVQPLS